MRSAYKPVWFIAFVVAALVAIVGIARRSPSAGGASDGKGHIAWMTDLEAARKQSYSTNKPVLLYFTASWCGPCKMMKESTWVDSQVASTVQERYVPVMIDVDEQKTIAQQYMVGPIPRLDVLTASGDRQTITIGYTPASDMLKKLR